MTSFLLALAYRSWVTTADDNVQDDIEDRRIARQIADDEGHFREPDARTRTNPGTSGMTTSRHRRGTRRRR